MNDIYKRPPKCQNCPFWEWATTPWLCKCKDGYENNNVSDNSQSERA